MQSRQSSGPRDWPEWPFCSPRCRLIDLGRWLGEDYRLASEDTDLDSAEDEPSDPPQAGRSFGRSQ